MTATGDQQDRPTVFQATISASRETMRAIRELDIDVLPDPGRIDEDRIRIEAIIRLDQLEALVAAGAMVTLQRTVDQTFPADRIMSEDESQARLRPLAQFREEEAE